MKKLLLCLPARRSLGIGGSLSLLVRRSLIISVCFLILQILGEGGSLLHSQVPQLMKYQAVLRDAVGNVKASESVTIDISIMQDSTNGTIVYTETHSTNTNAFGLVTLEIGSKNPSGFAAIDWAAGPYFLKISVDGTDMGTSQLLSVPYALYSSKTNTNAKFTINGTDQLNPDTALFEVRDKLGRPVFAVYEDGATVYVNEGAKGGRGGFAVGGRRPLKGDFQYEDIMRVTSDSVRIYINDTAVHKGGRGGFAVGGRKPAKGTVNDYLQVTPDSTRIYINDTYAKGGRGGFAVGGRKPSKGPVYDYLRVTPDSTRVFVNESTGKGGRGGFAVGGRKPAKGTANEYFNISNDTLAQVLKPSQARILWYPKKEAFLTGRVLVESPDSVGTNSMATGYESKAIGNWSQALGYKAIARGDYSTAIGKNSIANKINSFAFGENANARNEESYAFGRGAIAGGFRSFAFGSAGLDSVGNVTDVARALGDYSFALGQGSQTLGPGAFAIGIANTAIGKYSVALGYRTSAMGWYSTSIGTDTKASGSCSTAMGVGNTASGWFCSTAMGYLTVASGGFSTAMGVSTSASGEVSTAMGDNTTASGPASTAMGAFTKASGNYSTAMGDDTKASGDNSTSLGLATMAKSYASVAIGSYNDTTAQSSSSWIPTDPLFIIGNGASVSARTNALTVLKNGNVGIGTTSPSYKISVAGGAYCNGTNWVNSSDRNMKENFEVIDGKKILGLIENLPVMKWNYKAYNPDIKHIGPVAQDFYTLFGLGNDNKSISSIDPSGVALVAIKELSSQNKAMREQIEVQQKQIDELKTLVNSLIANQTIQGNK